MGAAISATRRRTSRQRENTISVNCTKNMNLDGQNTQLTCATNNSGYPSKADDIQFSMRLDEISEKERDCSNATSGSREITAPAHIYENTIIVQSSPEKSGWNQMLIYENVGDMSSSNIYPTAGYGAERPSLEVTAGNSRITAMSSDETDPDPDSGMYDTLRENTYENGR